MKNLALALTALPFIASASSAVAFEKATLSSEVALPRLHLTNRLQTLTWVTTWALA